MDAHVYLKTGHATAAGTLVIAAAQTVVRHYVEWRIPLVLRENGTAKSIRAPPWEL